MTQIEAKTKEVSNVGNLSTGGGILLLAILTVLWGSNWPTMKRALAEYRFGRSGVYAS